MVLVFSLYSRPFLILSSLLRSNPGNSSSNDLECPLSQTICLRTTPLMSDWSSRNWSESVRRSNNAVGTTARDIQNNLKGTEKTLRNNQIIKTKDVLIQHPKTRKMVLLLLNETNKKEIISKTYETDSNTTLW